YYQIFHPTGGNFEKCSDPEDANTISARSGGFAITAPPHGEWRWNKGDHITWVKSDVPLGLYFLRYGKTMNNRRQRRLMSCFVLGRGLCPLLAQLPPCSY